MASSLRNASKLVPVIRSRVQQQLSCVNTGFFRSFSSRKDVDEYSSHDNYFNENQHRPENGGLGAVDPTNRAFTYTVLGGSRFVFASMARLSVIKIVETLNIGKADLALAQTEVDITKVQEGECIDISWRGAPAFVRHRSPEEIASARATDWKSLRDPQSDEDRTQGNDPKWVVVMANCTHLGCIPVANAGNWQGFFCPCHGSHYDNCGRIRQGPAPLNLASPPYEIQGNLLIVG